MKLVRQLFLFSLLLNCASVVAQSQYVNPFIGASTDVRKAGAAHGLGKTFPGAATPFGMVQVSPQTVTGGDNGPGYSYEHKTIEGFSMTQMSGIGWYGDLGNFMVMPTTGRMYTVAGREDGSLKGWRSAYDKATEKAQAGYYFAHLSDYDIDVECSATTHCGILRFTFPDNPQSRIQIDLARRVGGTSVRQCVRLVDDHTLEGWMQCTPAGGGWGDGAGQALYTVYFHATLSLPMQQYGCWSADIPAGANRHRASVTGTDYLSRVAEADVWPGRGQLEGDHIGFYTQFPTHRGEQVTMKVGISFVDIDGARRNYQAEMDGKTFEQIRTQATQQWNEALSRVSIEGGTEREKTIFYTALYHTMIDPRTYQDVDGRYVGGDYKIHQASDGFIKRTIFSGWDVFRSQFPLQTIINPRLVSDMINSLVGMAEQSGKGYLERWEFLNAYSGCMLGNPAISIIVDAYAKGIRTFDVRKAYDYCIRTAQQFGNGENGYTPGKHSISYTLEQAYSDWCVGRMARMLGDKKTACEYLLKGQAYHNVYDSEKDSYRPRNDDGTWMEWPEKGKYQEGYGCVECNPLQQGWFVPQDVAGMARMMGGTRKTIADLDDMFGKTPRDMFWNEYYNHANEPVHHIPYLYNRLGEPYKTQYWTRFICEHAYDSQVEGLRGNEDVGQMSAWYVLSAAGLHPVCPGDTRMEITSPVFDRVQFRLDSTYWKGGTFTVITHGNSPANVYIQRMLLNGKMLKHCWLDFSQIVQGGTLELFMGPSPCKRLK